MSSHMKNMVVHVTSVILSLSISPIAFSQPLTNVSETSNANTATKHPPYNIILIINDQETYHLANAPGFQLPARKTLMQHGITFRNHYTAAAMCSPSRATFLTGAPPQTTGVFDQMEYSFVPSLNPTRMNMGSALKALGLSLIHI